MAGVINAHGFGEVSPKFADRRSRQRTKADGAACLRKANGSVELAKAGGQAQ